MRILSILSHTGPGIFSTSRLKSSASFQFYFSSSTSYMVESLGRGRIQERKGEELCLTMMTFSYEIAIALNLYN